MPRLVDMFDQAILYLHLDNGQAGPGNDLTILRHSGIRTATNLAEAYQATDPVNQPVFLNLLNGSDREKLPRLATIIKTLADDDWMPYLRNWRKFSRTPQTIYDPQSLYNDSFVVCPACHAANGSDNRFCSSCGPALQNKPISDGQPLTLKPLTSTLPSDVGKAVEEQKPTEAAAPLTTSN